jgi:hypothetical protein
VRKYSKYRVFETSDVPHLQERMEDFDRVEAVVWGALEEEGFEEPEIAYIALRLAQGALFRIEDKRHPETGALTREGQIRMLEAGAKVMEDRWGDRPALRMLELLTLLASRVAGALYAEDLLKSVKKGE